MNHQPWLGGRAVAFALVVISIMAPRATLAAGGGPDTSGYRWSDNSGTLDSYAPVYSWSPISGTALTLSDDQLSSPISLPFPFTFYGVSYSSLTVSSNGYLSFTNDTNGCCQGIDPPNAAAPNGWVGFHWNDMYPPATGGLVSYASGGVAPNRYFVVEFNAVAHCCSVGSYPASAQVWLYEGSTEIVYQLNNATSDGSQTTIGIENQAGTAGLLYASSTVAGTFLSGRAVRFYQSPPTSLRFSSAPQSTAVGGCSAITTVRPHDVNGNPTATQGTTTVSLTATGGTVTFYSDSSCTTAISSLAVPPGSVAVNFYYRASTAGTMTLTASAPGLTAGSQTATVLSSRLRFLTAPQSVLNTACSGIATVQHQDGAGAPLNVGVATPVSLTASSGTMLFYSDAACGSVVTSVTLPAGGNSASFYFRDPTYGTPTVTAATTGVIPATQVETISSPVPSEYPWTTNQSGSLSIDVAWDYTMGYQFTPQGSGRVTRLCGYFNGTKEMRLYSRSSGAILATTTVTSANAWSCSSIPPVAVTAGTSYSVAVVLGGTGGSYRSVSPPFPQTWNSIRIDGSCYASGSTAQEPCSYSGLVTTTMYGQADIGFLPDPPTGLAIVSAAQTLVAGTCSSPVTVQAQNNTWPATVIANTQVNLSSNSGSMTFYAAADTTCVTPLSAVTIAAGSSNAQFRFRDSAVGTPLVTAASPGLTSATQSQTLTATVLAFSTAAQSIAVGTCSAPTTVQNRNGSGTPVTVGGNTTVNLTSSSAGLTLYSDPTCTTPITSIVIGAGTSASSFYFKDVLAEEVVITATAAVTATGSQTQTITPCTAYETPLATNGTGSNTLNVTYNSTLGYQFTPTTAGSIWALCGFFSGAQTVYLVNRSSGAVLRSASVTSANAWSCTNITPVQVNANTAYSVAVNMTTGGVQRDLGAPAARALPKTWGNIIVQYGCSAAAGITDPCTSSLNTRYLDGLVDVRFAPETVTGLAIASAPQTVAVGSCSAPSVVETRGCNGSRQRVSVATGIALSSSAATTSFYASTDSTCATALTSVIVPANSDTVSFRFRDTVAGTPTVTAAATGLGSAGQVEIISAGAATRVAINSPAQTVSAGACSGLATVQTRDSLGNPSNVGSATTVNLSTSASATGRFYSDASCTAQVSLVVVGAGSNSAGFYFRDTAAGSPTLTAAVTGFTSGTQVETITAAAASRLTFTSATQSVSAGGCSAVAAFRTEDAFGNLSAVGPALGVTLTSSSPAGTFYSDPGCTTAVAGAVVGAGQTVGNFYFSDTGAGAPTLTLSATGFTSGTQVQTIVAGPAALLVFANAPPTVPAGGCSPALAAQARDAYNNPTVVGVATLVSLSSTAGTGTFYQGAGCVTPITTSTIAGGSSATTFYYGDTTLGTPTLTAAATGFISGSQIATVTAGAASRLAIASAAQTLPAGTCSGLATAQTRDSFGNPAPVGAATTVTLGTNSAGGTFYSNSTCTTAIGSVLIASGTSSATFYFKDTRAGGPTLTLTSGVLASGSQVQTINPAPVARLAFLSGAQNLVAGTCSAVTTVQSRDAWDNVSPVAAATAVTLSSSSTGGTFYSDASCTSAIAGVTIPAGASSVGFYFKETRAGSPVLTAASAGLTSGTQTQTISAATATQLAMISPSRAPIAGACSLVVTATAQDPYANAATVAAATTVNLTSSSTGDTFYSDPTCTTVVTSQLIAAGASATSFYFKDTVVGSPTITAAATGLSSGTQVQTVTAAPPSRLTFLTAPQSLSAGSCSAIASIQSRDAFDNPSTVAAATTVTLSTTSGTGTFYSNASCTTAVGSVVIGLGGTVASFYFRDTTVGSPTLTAASTGFTSATQVETITVAAANRLVFVTSSQTIAAGACSAITTIQSQDSLGVAANVIANTTVTLSSNSATSQYYSDSGCTVGVANVTIVAGTSSASFYFRDTTVGSPTLTGASGSFTSGNQAETIIAASASTLAFSSAPQSLSAGACSAVAVVQSRDAFNNVSNVGAATTVNLGSSSGGNIFYSDATCTTVATSRLIALGTSSTTFYFRDTTAGTPTLTASATGFTSGTQAQAISAGAAARLAFTTPARTQLAGACSAVITVQTQDGFNNATNVGAATAVSLTTGSTGGLFYSDAACTTAVAGVTVAAGTSSANLYYRDTRAGTATLSAISAGLTTGTQNETITPAGAVKVVFTTPVRSVVAGDCSAIATTVTQDLYDNTSPVTAATTLTYSAVPADVTFYSNSTCTTVITSASLAANASTASVYFRSNLAGTKTLTVAATGFTSATQSATITAGTASRLAFATAAQSVTAGACAAITTVRSQDSLGNTSNVAAATAVSLSDSSGAGTFYSNSTCTTAIAGVTIGAGTSTVSFYWKDTRAGSSTLTASATGFTSGTQVQTISPAAANRLTWISAPLSVSTGTCSTGLTVQRQDVYGNAVTGGGVLAVTLGSSSAGNAFFAAAGCATAVSSVSIAAGTSSAIVYLRDTVAGSPTVTASAAGLGSGTQVQTIVPGAASRLAFTSAAQSLTAGACSGQTTLSSQDAYGNPAAVASATSITLSSSAGGTTFYSDASCATAISGVTIAAAGQTAGFYFRVTSAGAATLTAAATGFTSGTQVETIGAGAPARLIYLSAPQTVAAGSCSGAAAVVQSQDAFGNAANVGAATSVSLSSSSATGIFSAAAGCAVSTTSVTLSAGTNSTTFYFRDTTAGAPSLTASALGLTSAVQAQTVVPAAASALDFVSAAQTLSAGSCSAPATVLVRDVYGNPVPGAAPRTVSLSATSGTLAFFSDASCATLASGLSIPTGASGGSFYFRESTAGSPSLTASSTGLTFATQTQTILAGAPSTLAFVSSPQTLTAGGCSGLTTVQSRDGNSNPADVTAVTSVALGTTSSGGAFYSDAACTTAVASVTIAAGTNTASFYFRDTRAGSPTLSASAAGLATSTQIETINPGTTSRLGITSSAQNIVAGTCSGALVIQSQDGFSNQAQVSAATTVGLASSSGTNLFYADSTCTTVVTTAALAAGTSTATVYFRDTLAGSPTLTASATGLTSGTQVQTVRAAPAARLAFTSAAQTISAGACSALATLQTRDTFNNASTLAAATTVALTSTSAGGRFYSDAACSAEVTSVTVAGGASSAGFYFRDTNAGSPTLTASATGLTSITQVQVINPAAASRLVFTTAAQTLTAGNCSGVISLQSQDAVGNPSNVATATTLSLTRTSAGGTFYSDSTCATVVTTATIAAGTSTTSFWYRDTLAGTSTVTVAATGFTSGAQTQTINAATVNRLAFTTAAQSRVAGVCSAIVSLQSRDTYGNPANVTAATAVTLSSTSAGGTFYSDAACATPIAGLTIAAGTRTGSFYFKDTRSGTPTLTSAAVGLLSATQVQTISPAAPVRLAAISTAQSLVAGACSAAVSLQVQDTFGNASPVTAATAVSLSSTSAGGSFFSGAGCSGPIAGLTLAAGSSSATFYFRDTLVGTPTLTAAATGLTSATQAQTISAAPPSRLEFLTPSQTLTAGACSGVVTVQTQDAFNNPSNVTAATAITFISTSTGDTFYSDAACTVVVTGVSLAAGTNQGSLYFRDTRAGSPTVTASATGLTAANQAHSISPAPASRLAFTNAPLNLTAGSCSSALTVTSQDTYGNVTPVTVATVVSLSTSSVAGTFYQSGTCGTVGNTITIAAGTTSASAFYGDTRAGTPTVTAAAAGFTSGTQVEAVTPAAATRLAFISAAQAVTAGVCSAVANVQAEDVFGNAVNVASTTTVNLTTNSPGGTFAAEAGCGTAVTGVTLAAGTSTIGFYFRDTRSGSSTLTAAATGLTAASQVETVTPAAAALLSFASAAQSVVAGGCSALATARTQDTFGNTSNVGASTVVTLTSSSAGGTFFSNSTCTTAVGTVTIPAGTSSAGFYFRDTLSGSPTLTLAATGLTSATQVQTITPASPTQLVFTSAAQAVVAGACSGAATLQARDAFGNPSPVGGATSVSLSTTSPSGTFFADAACTVTIAATSVAAGTSASTFFFKDTRTGTPTLTAAAAGLTAATQVETINPGAAARLAFTTAAQTLVAGNCSGTVSVQAQDTFGNAAPMAGGATVTLASTSGAGAFYSGAGCGTAVGTVAIPAGGSNASFAYRDTLVGAPTLSVSAPGLTLAMQGQTITPAPASVVVFVSPPQTLTAGACSPLADLRTRDAFGNVSPVAVATALALSTTSSGGSFFSDPGCGAPVASVTLAAGASGASFYFLDTRVGTPTLTAATAGLLAATQTHTIVPAAASRLAFTSTAQSLTAGTCSALTTLQSQDAYGNAANVPAAASVALSTDSPAGAFYSDAACTTLVTVASIAAGTNGGSFYFKDTRAGGPTLTLAAAGLTSATQVENITPAAASRLAYVTLAQSVTAGTCSAVAQVQSQDVYANPSNVAAATTVTLSSTSGTFRFFSDATCATQVTQVTIAGSANLTGFFFSDTAAGTPTASASATGLVVAPQVETINPAPASRLVVTTPVRTVTAGACSAIVTVQAQDALGNASPVAVATPIALATTSTGGTFYSDPGCTAAVSGVTVAAFSSTASFYFKDTRAGSPTLSGASSGFASATQVEVVSAASPARLVVLTAPQVRAAGVCSGVVTVQTQDTYGNPSDVSLATTINLATNSAGGAFYSDATCGTATTTSIVAASTNTTSFYFRDTRAGSPVLTFSSGVLTPVTQTQTITPATASQVAFTSAAQTVVAGACSAITSLQTRDPFGNAAPVSAATAIALSSTSATGTFFSNSTCTTAIAQATIASGATTAAFYFRDTRSGTATLTAAPATLTSATQLAIFNPAPATRLVFTTAALNQLAGACSGAVTLQTRDVFGNASNVTAATVVNLASSSAGGTFSAAAGCGTTTSSVTIPLSSSGITFYYRDTLVGTPTLTPAAAGLTVTPQVETITPAGASVLVFTSAAQTLLAGACSAAATLQTRDAFGNVSPLGTAASIGLSTTSTGGAFYSDATCTTLITSFPVAAGASSGAFYFRDTRAGSPVLTAAPTTGLSSASQGATINPAALARVSFVTAAQTLIAGACSALNTLQTEDAFGNARAVAAPTVLGLSSGSATTLFYADAACSVALSSVSIGAGGTTAGFYFRDTTVGTPTIVAATAGIASGTQTQTINPAAPNRLVFTTATQTVLAGACSTVATVQVRDVFGNASPLSADATVALTSSSGTGTFAVLAGCGTAVTSAIVTAGSSSLSFYFRDTVTGTPTLSASAAGLITATQVQTIGAAPASALVFTTASQTLVAGACSAITGLQTRDSFGNASNVTAATTVGLSSNSAGGGFFSDSTCLSAISSVSVAAGANARTFYFRDTRSGSPTLTLTAATGLTPATQVQTINPGAATVVAITTPSRTIIAGACSAVVSVQTRDTFGNASAVGAAAAFTLSSNGATTVFYSNSTCATVVTTTTVAAGGNAASFYFRATLTGTPSITVARAGFTSATQVQTVNPSTAIRLAFTSPVQTVVAGACSALTVTRTQDTYGNAAPVTAATAVALSSSGGGTFYSDASCITAISSVTVAIGLSTVNAYVRHTTSGTPTLTASATGLTPTTQPITINPATPVRLAFASAAQTIPAGGCSAAITVQTRDTYGNASNVATSILATLSTSSLAGSFYADPSCNSPIAAVTVVVGTSLATLYYQDTLAGASTLTASSSGLASGTQVATIVPAAPTRVSFVTAPQTLSAGGCSAVATVEAQDAFGNASPLGGATAVALSSTSLTGTFSTIAGCGTQVTSVSLPAGQTRVNFYFRDSAAGTPTISATPAGLSTATQEATIVPASAAVLAFATAPQTLNAGACSGLITVESRDGNGNASAVTAPLTVSLTTTAGTGAFYSDPGCTAAVTTLAFAIGSSSGDVYFKDTAVGSRTLTAAAASGFVAATQLATITTAGSATRLSFTTAAQMVVAGGCSALAVVQSQDSFGNAVNLGSGAAVALSSSAVTGAFFSNSTCTTAVSTVSIPAGGNTVTFYFRDTRAGTPTLTAAAGGLSNAVQVETIDPGAPTALGFTTPPRTIGAGACSPLIGVRVQDSFGNTAQVASAAPVALTTSSPGGTFYSDAACTSPTLVATIGSGQSTTSFYYSDTRSGAATLTVASGGRTSATQAQTITTGASTQLAFVTAAQALTAGGCSALTSVQAQDTLGNASAVGAVTVITLSTSSSGGTLFSDPLCANPISSRTLSAIGTTVTFYFKDTLVGSPTLTASAPGLTDATQVQTVLPGPAGTLAVVTPPRSVSAGACSRELLVEARDDLGNAAAVQGPTSVVPSSNAVTGDFFADEFCTTSVIAVVIPTGSSSVNLYYRDTLVGTPTITVANPGLVGAVQVVTVTPAAADHLTIVTAPQTTLVAACSAMASFEVRDAFANLSTVNSQTLIALASNAATTRFFSDASCTTAITDVTVAALGSQGSFFFSDTRAGTADVTVSAPSLIAGSQAEVFTPGAAVGLAFSTPERTAVAGACSDAVTLEARDSLNNPTTVASARAVALSSSSSGLQFFSDAACTTALTTASLAAGGGSVSFYFRDPRAGSLTLTGSDPTLGTVTQSATVVAAAVAKLAFATPPLSVPSTVCSRGVVLEARDAFDNAAAVTADEPITVTSSSATMVFFTDDACTTGSNGVTITTGNTFVNVYLRDATAGTATLTGTSLTFGSANQLATITAGPPIELAFITPPQTLPTGVCSAAATVQARDVSGNAAPIRVGGVQAALFTTSTGGTFYSDVACSQPVTTLDLPAGQSSGTFYFKDSVVGSPTLDVAATGLTATSQQQTIFAAAQAVGLGFVGAPATLEAGRCSGAIEVQAQDANGASAPLTAPITVALTLGSTVAHLYSDATCSTEVTSFPIAVGDYRATFFLKDAIVEPVLIQAQTATLTGGSVTVQIVCPATVDGAFCDDGDLCNGRERCLAGSCASSPALVCDDNDSCTNDSCAAATGCSNVVTSTCCTKPVIARDANLVAAVGVPYRLNPTAQLTLLRGTGPITWAACATGPSGLQVDATTGAVDWTPAAAGQSSLCLQATGACGVDAYSFTVDVLADPGAGPVAVLSLPPSVAAGVPITANGSASTPAVGLSYVWSFGDGTALQTGARPTHTYARAGGYTVRLTVFTPSGQSAQAQALLRVTSVSCPVPPTVRIVSDQTNGTDQLAAQLSADFQGDDPNPVLRWNFGDGTAEQGTPVSHTFGPGTHLVSLEAITREGCTARDSQVMVVNAGTNSPPHCAVTASPVAGLAPLATTFSASYGDSDGQITSASWLFSDGVTADALRFNGAAARVVDQPGGLTATLEVTDDRGATCRTSVRVEASNGQQFFPPEIVSVPTLTAQCEVPWTYGADGIVRASGSRPLTWELGRASAGIPEGMSLDQAGAISWTPAKGNGKRSERVTIVAQNAAGSVEQDFMVEVDCAPQPTGCSCSTFPGSALWLFGVAALTLVSRRRRARARSG